MKCTTAKYDRLYARWLKQPGALLDLAGYQPGQQLLDLCGGTGVVSREALRRGADPSTIMLVDLNPRCPDVRVHQVAGNVDALGPTVFGGRRPECHHRFDLIVIRQAAAYLRWDFELVGWIRTLLKPGGKLVFNTFRRPRWSAKTYLLNGIRYFEASACWGRTVWHLQAAPRIGWDISRFTFFPEEQLRSELSRVFTVETKQQGRSVHWLCTAPGR